MSQVMKSLALLKNVGLPEVSLTFAAALQHAQLLYNHLFAVTVMLILKRYFFIFSLPVIIWFSYCVWLFF